MFSRSSLGELARRSEAVELDTGEAPVEAASWAAKKAKRNRQERERKARKKRENKTDLLLTGAGGFLFISR